MPSQPPIGASIQVFHRPSFASSGSPPGTPLAGIVTGHRTHNRVTAVIWDEFGGWPFTDGETILVYGPGEADPSEVDLWWGRGVPTWPI